MVASLNSINWNSILSAALKFFIFWMVQKIKETAGKRRRSGGDDDDEEDRHLASLKKSAKSKRR